MEGKSVLIKHKGGCHCGKVRFEVMAPQNLRVYDCNCSICIKKQNKHFIVPKRNLVITQGEDNLACYSFNTHLAKHFFCKSCGVQSFYVPRSNQDGYGVAPHCLDEGTVGNIVTEFVDGKNWEKWIEENPDIKSDSK
ncbi:predicted protein [Nematostella vectensis]|uniref:CENP-V/GFA domain-containing protein n=1 Tax=Nematostella vectensis TaxID=45351 RepID=A7S8U1_NEMVE|nr:centromere protein V [Nematostella vectensis]EDO39925.1 predicted protein [Nematostella vectensis]|eukprot:XP_001631988.1 predicted protein [Nematostella vectensis]